MMTTDARIEIFEGDITTLDVDAIVNAANERLAPGGGVCGAIHRAAGPELAEACARIAPCATGGARATPGFKLKARIVIHAVGPVWQGGGQGEPDKLAGAYRDCRSIAFPAISTGIYGYPLTPATHLAVATIRDELERPGAPERVVFACFGSDVAAAYRQALTSG
jgi:O-acetyl-ADP-ribose deacetylase (regulator of RNase III)